jgi:hypothetical protein
MAPDDDIGGLADHAAVLIVRVEDEAVRVRAADPDRRLAERPVVAGFRRFRSRSRRLRSLRVSASRISRSIAGASRPRSSFITYSFAPARSASTAGGSPIVSEWMMNGRSGSRSRSRRNASMPLNPGSRSSATIAGHGGSFRSASRYSPRVATPLLSKTSPSRSRAAMVRAASSSESSRSSRRMAVPFGIGWRRIQHEPVHADLPRSLERRARSLQLTLPAHGRRPKAEGEPRQGRKKCCCEDGDGRHLGHGFWLRHER